MSCCLLFAKFPFCTVCVTIYAIIRIVVEYEVMDMCAVIEVNVTPTYSLSAV